MARDDVERWERRYNPSAAGTTQIFTIPKGSAVIGAYMRVDTARVGGTSLTIGDGADVDGLFTASPDTSTGMKDASGAYVAEANGKIYASDDTIDAVLTGTPSTYPDLKLVIYVRRVIGG